MGNGLGELGLRDPFCNVGRSTRTVVIKHTSVLQPPRTILKVTVLYQATVPFFVLLFGMDSPTFLDFFAKGNVCVAPMSFPCFL